MQKNKKTQEEKIKKMLDKLPTEYAEYVRSLIEDEEKLFKSKDIKDDVEIVKAWIERKLNGELEDFEDLTEYSFRRNEKGNIDITIKNVECIF